MGEAAARMRWYRRAWRTFAVVVAAELVYGAVGIHYWPIVAVCAFAIVLVAVFDRMEARANA